MREERNFKVTNHDGSLEFTVFYVKNCDGGRDDIIMKFTQILEFTYPEWEVELLPNDHHFHDFETVWNWKNI